MIDPPRAEAKDAVARAKARRHPAADDHRRPPAHGRRHRRRSSASPRTAARSPAPSSRSCPDEALARTVAEVSVYARVNPEHKLRIVDALQRTRRRRGDDRRRRERRAGAEEGRHRHRHGHHRHGRVEGGGRHGAGRRQLRLDRRRGRRRPRDLRQHPQVPALPAVVEHRRGADDVLRRAARGAHRPATRRAARSCCRCWRRRSCGSTW